MVKIKDFEFSLREFAGALGDFGPLNPFILGYISILGLNPVGIFLAMGLTNIILGLVYNLPLPVEPKKVIGTIALKDKWHFSQIYLSGLLTGFVWLLLSFTGIVKRLARITPVILIRGIQFSLMLILIKESIELIKTNIFLALLSIVLIILLIRNRFLPSAIAVFCLGLFIIFLSNPNLSIRISFFLPSIFIPSIQDITLSLLIATFTQVILTFSNAILATCLAINERFPNKRIEEENLAINMGLMNSFFSFIGGIPMCHGAEGFASQYFFGGRTGGAMIIEGICEIILALFFADSITIIFNFFPLAIIGAMLLFAGLELGKFMIEIDRKDLIIVIIIGIFSFFTNIAIGFLIGFILYHIFKKMKQNN